MNRITHALLTTTAVVGVALAVAGGSAFAADAVRPIISAPAPAAPWDAPSYVSIFGGLALANDPSGQYSSYNFQVPTNSGYVFGAAVGGNVTPHLRAEVELSYVHHGVTGSGVWIDDESDETNSGSFNTLYALGNFWYDLHPGAHISPYVGAGAGLAVVMPRVTNIYGDGTDYQYTKNAYAPAAQVGAGFRVPIGQAMMLDVGYRLKGVFSTTLQATGSSSFEPVSGLNYIDQTVQGGLTINW